MNIYESIGAILKDVNAVGKNQKNKTQGFNFRGIDDVYNHVHPLLAKHGVFSVPFVVEDKSEERQTKTGGTLIYRILTISYKFYAEDGTFVEARVIGEGMDSGDKASNKAMAIAHKYAILQILALPTEDMIDPDSESPEGSVKVTKPIKTIGVPKPLVEVPRTVEVFEAPKTPVEYEMISEEEFDPLVAYHQLISMPNSSEDLIKSMLKNLGVTSAKLLPYNHYVTAHKYAQLFKGTKEE